jgi:hypothetical protein
MGYCLTAVVSGAMLLLWSLAEKQLIEHDQKENTEADHYRSGDFG